MKLGYIGLGAMGLPFARHLKAAGHDVAVLNRSDRPYAEARRAGLSIAASVSEVVEVSDVLFTCLPNSQIINDIYEQIDKPGLICCDNSTVPYEQATQLHNQLNERGMAYVECPIFGSAQDAIDRTVYLVISGDAAPVQTVMPIARQAARDIAVAGGPGAASLIKTLQNGLGHVQMVAIAETLAMAEDLGLDLNQFVDIVSHCGGMASTRLFQRKAPQMLAIPEETGAKLDIAAKDAMSASKLFTQMNNSSALIHHAAEKYTEAQRLGLGARDFAAVFQATRRREKR
ncbi:NAD(P)-dependent oxidoreductase [Oricola sp.]|uniref:NAD(P)-dependent oxidoreductase n=1 Tax=Oricola sp. TaxID=1979950 RepID=UPI003BAB78CF